MPQWKIEKEEFVSGFNGTTLVEIFVSSAISPLCILLHSLIIGFLPLYSSSPFEITRFVVDFIFLIFPMILVVTILSNFYAEFFCIIFLVCVTMAIFIKKYSFIEQDNSQNAHSNNKDALVSSIFFTFSNLKSIKVNTLNVPFLTSFKAYVNVATCICILAVDFHVFPRRLAKAENFGCGIMDLGVGGFIMSNAVVSKEAKNRWKSQGLHVTNFRATCIQIFSSWPLIMLGVARLISVKMSGYQEHVTEYGLHWNFFFTLAFVKIFSSLILFFIDLKYCALLSVTLAVSYQYSLISYPFLLNTLLGNARSGSILMQNKEGIASLLGYLSLYFAGIEYGAFIFKPRNNLGQWLKVSQQLFCVGCIFCTLMLFSINYIQPISRRLANLSYILAFLTYATILLFCYLIGDIFTVFLIHNQKLNVNILPNTWAIKNKVNKTKHDNSIKINNGTNSLISAINRNQLFYFLLSNVLTGLVNSSINTMSFDDYSATFIIILYCFFANFVAWVMHANNFTFKFW